jgi:hypothetical protein
VSRARLVALLALAAAGPAGAQEVRVAVVPDTVTTGDVFRVAVRVIVPRGGEVAFPDSLTLPPDLERAATPVVVRDSLDRDRDELTVTYGLAAWRPGVFDLPATEVRIGSGAAATGVEVRFPRIVVASVLPADTAGVEPQPPRGVLGPDRALLPLLLLAALAALAAGAAVWLLRKRRRPGERPAAGIPARDRALAELDRLRRSGLLEGGQYKIFCAAVSGVVRAYLAALQPDWSPDLTTTELARALRAETVPLPARIRDAEPAVLIRDDGKDPLAALVGLLGAADVVKFTGIAGSAATADTLWTRARTWVGSYDAAVRRAA